MKSVLVTTAIEKTWPSANEPILFLGEWCLLYSEKEKWEKFNYRVASYHWDDRTKAFNDYKFLNILYEELLCDLAKKLNSIHNVNHSIRYWRVIIGPWLGFFLQAVFDRWITIQKTLQDNNISYVNVLKNQGKNFIPNDMDHFSNMFIDDSWNEYIYGEILKFFNFKKIKYITNSKIKDCSETNNNFFNFNMVKKKCNTLVNFISGLISKDSDYFLISTYLPIKKSILLQIKLGQFPKIWRSISISHFDLNYDLRNWSLSKKKLKKNTFAAFIRDFIPMNIPLSVLEGFYRMQEVSRDISWPKVPKAIFTSNAFWLDEVFKFWCANLIENGTPLITSQHGGNYGVALWSFMEDHQTSISDLFLTWGWRNDKKRNIKPLGILKNLGLSVKSNKNGYLLLVQMMLPRYSYHMYSVPISSSQFSSYLSDQYDFVKNLPCNIQEKLLIRVNSYDYGYDVNKRWLDNFPFIKLDYGRKSMLSSMRDSRIFISTYNATTFLESMSANFPTIIFWNVNFWELNKQSIPYFELLEEVGIFHKTPESAAKKVINVWDDVDKWWNGKLIQAARIKFCYAYARTPSNPLKSLKNVILNV